MGGAGSTKTMRNARSNLNESFDYRTFQNIQNAKGDYEFPKEKNFKQQFPNLGDNLVRAELRKGSGLGNTAERMRRH